MRNSLEQSAYIYLKILIFTIIAIVFMTPFVKPVNSHTQQIVNYESLRIYGQFTVKFFLVSQRELICCWVVIYSLYPDLQIDGFLLKYRIYFGFVGETWTL